jgi:hypothetical protein
MFEPEIARLLEDLEAHLQRTSEAAGPVTRIEPQPTQSLLGQPLSDQPPDISSASPQSHPRQHFLEDLALVNSMNFECHPQDVPRSHPSPVPELMQGTFPIHESPLQQISPARMQIILDLPCPETSEIATHIDTPRLSSPPSSKSSPARLQPAQSNESTATLPRSPLFISMAGYIRDRWWTPGILNIKGQPDRSIFSSIRKEES